MGIIVAQGVGASPVGILEHPLSRDVSWPGRMLAIPRVELLMAPTPVGDGGLFVWQRSIVDAAGSTLNDARVSVRYAETNSLAEIYADRLATTRKSNPFMVDEEGFARFYAAAGLYKITAERLGLERIFENVLLGIRAVDLPDLSAVIAPIAAQEIAAALAQFTIPDGYIVAGVGSVGSSGGALSLPTGWSSALDGDVYTVTHNLARAAGSYAALLSATQGGGHANPQVSEYATNSFSYRVFNDENGTLTNTPVRFAVVLNQKFGAT